MLISSVAHIREVCAVRFGCPLVEFDRRNKFKASRGEAK